MFESKVIGLNKKEILDKMLDERDGILLTSEVIAAGISKTYFMEYVKKMGMERMAMGVYLAADAWPDYFYVLQARYPKVIFSHETALYLLGLAEREPLQFTVTAKAGYHAKSMDEQNIKVYRMKEDLLEMGVTEVASPAGHMLRVYNGERTICDLLRSRSNIEIQDLQGALKEYVRSREKNLPQLMRYAKELHMEKVLRPYLEILLS